MANPNISKPFDPLLERTINQIRNWLQKIGFPVKVSAGGTGMAGAPNANQILIGSPGNTYDLKTFTDGLGTRFNNGNNFVRVDWNFARTPITVVDSPYSVLESDFLISVDTNGGAVIVDLPDPITIVAGQVFIINDEGGNAAVNNITVQANGGANLIDGAVNQIINVNYSELRVYNSGINYFTF